MTKTIYLKTLKSVLGRSITHYLLQYHVVCSLVREKLIGLFSYFFLANFVISSLVENFSRTLKMLLAMCTLSSRAQTHLGISFYHTSLQILQV